jgi:serine/threonine-protein kinase HipA
MKTKRLLVTLPGHSVGALTQDITGRTAWLPDPKWEATGQQPRLGLDFLRSPGRRVAREDIPPWFTNLLPERGSPLRERFAAQFGIREGQSFDLLRLLGADLVGAVEVRDDSRERVAEALGAEVPHDNLAATTDSERPSALTGMQLKLAMSMVQDRLVVTAKTKNRLYIVKFAGSDYPELAEVEAATMTWAARAGFAVPDHFTCPMAKLDGVPEGWAPGNADVFVIRRFDRRDDGTKLHQEDLCQALGLRPVDKYGDGTARHISAEGALRLIVDACGEDDGREMARRLGFIVASGNTDAHLKNWTLVWGEATRPRLSPCYDLVSTISWPRFGWERKGGPTLALALGGTHQLASLNDAVLDVATTRSTYEWLKPEILAGVERAADAWSAVTAPDRMRAALKRHWESVPLLAALASRFSA